ncbi:hypothetical protein V8F20_011701 [Naviculisporaceae sp. PSN 640]
MDASPLKRVMPRELLLMVLDELSPQLLRIDCNMCMIAKCTCWDDTEAITAHRYRILVNENIRALSALSRTCNELRALVTPLLYACPLTPTLQGGWFLARTLIDSPKLAQLVRILMPIHPGLSTERSHNKEPPPEVMAFCIGRKTLPTSLDAPESRISSSHRQVMKTLAKGYDNNLGIPVDFITSLCPNLEDLCIRRAPSPYGARWSCIRPWAFWGDGMTFPKLKRVSVDMWRANQLFGERQYLPLLRRIPNLESLHILKCNAEAEHSESAMPGLVLHKLRFLELGTVYRGEERLDKILPMMPNIEQLVINYEVSLLEPPDDLDWDNPPITPVPLFPKMAVHYIARNRDRASKLRKFTVNYMLPFNSWRSRCSNTWVEEMPADEVFQRCRDELDEATEMLAQLGIVLTYTIPSAADCERAIARRRGGWCGSDTANSLDWQALLTS